MKIYAFILTMPNVGSWNGKFTGENNLYVRFKKMNKEQLEKSKLEERNYSYNFGDGWRANVEVLAVDSNEKRKLEKQSKGFMGYEWMISSIIENGKIVS